jgi:putative ABC transport system permease protein
MSTILGIALGIAAACTLVVVYGSLERELNQWTSGANAKTIQVLLLPKGMAGSFYEEQEKAVEGLEFFRAPFAETPQSNVASTSSVPSFFMPEDIAFIQELSAVRLAAWELTFFDPFVTEKDRIYIYQVPYEYFEMVGLSLSEGRFPTPNDPSNSIVLTSEGRRKLFEDKPAVGQQLTPTLWGWNEPMIVSGVLEPVGPAYHFLADYMNNKIYLPTEVSLGKGSDNTTDHARGIITSLWIQPHLWEREKAIQQISEFLNVKYGDTNDIQITGARENALYLGGIAMREFFLLRFVWAVAFAELVATLNIIISVKSLLAQRKHEFGVRRCLGATGRILAIEFLRRATVYGIVSGAIGILIAVPLSMWFGAALQFCTAECTSVPVRFGWLTISFGMGMGIGLWWLGTLLSFINIIKYSPAALLRETVSFSSKPKSIIGWLGFAVSISALLITLGIRDGTISQFNRILGWSGGERAGAFVSWSNDTTQPDGMPLVLTKDHYWLLRDKFPGFQVGWLSTKGSSTEMTTLDASSSIYILRPPVLLAGRWFTSEEEADKSYVAVLGPQLAVQVAEEMGVATTKLIGQKWHSYTIIGVMDDWPALYSMGYYPDVAYVPVDVQDPSALEWPLMGQIPFIIPEGRDSATAIQEMSQTLQTLDLFQNIIVSKKQPKFILPANVIRDALTWRTRLILMLTLFAGFSLFIGAVGVMNQVFIWIVSRWREIGIRRAIGATRGEVARMVLAQALQITLLATLVGGTIGTAIALIVQKRSGWPLTVYPYWLAAALGVGLFSAVIFGGIPAWWAATRTPTEMLRME